MEPSNLIEQDPIVQMIRARERELFDDKLLDALQQCPKCCGHEPGIFRLHALRKRIFLVASVDLVYRIRSSLGRWKCLLCGQTFTFYPSFALPYKRYVTPTILARSKRYVQEDTMTYRAGVTQEGRPGPLYHAAADPEQIDDRSLAPSTLHRWISTLGQRTETLRSALDLIKQADPACGLFRRLPLLQPHPRKYRSQQRKKLLTCCRQLLETKAHYVRIFGVSLFPYFATAGASP